MANLLSVRREKGIAVAALCAQEERCNIPIKDHGNKKDGGQEAWIWNGTESPVESSMLRGGVAQASRNAEDLFSARFGPKTTI
jgi:hypothetical protein